MFGYMWEDSIRKTYTAKTAFQSIWAIPSPAFMVNCICNIIEILLSISPVHKISAKYGQSQSFFIPKWPVVAKESFARKLLVTVY